MEIIPLIFGIVIIIFVLFTKHSEVIFLGEDQYCYNYGFPLRSFITNSDNFIIHIYTANIIINILLLFPVFLSVLLCFIKNKFTNTNQAIVIIFSFLTIFIAFLSWNLKCYIFYFAMILYSIGIIWFIFLAFYFIRRKLSINDRKRRTYCHKK